MAENKKAVVVYADWIDKFESLEDDEAGRLIKHFFRYVNDMNPDYPDRITEISFIDIKNSLKRDLQKWEKTLEGRSKAGKASAEKRRLAKLAKQELTNPTSVESVEENPTNPTDSVSDSVNDIIYTQKDFLEMWKKARLHYDKQPTNITDLKPFELVNFNKILKNYGSEDFYKAINGLFFQETFKQTRLRPTHFLENFETYLTCWQTKEKLFTPKKKESKL